ncbi:hypothetical protein [Bacteroides sp.]|jgi:hypothetical protein|uniref:hypothetical protein n=1 Tax=Bacteroides sp. TaxID=29523 RepID=UPI003AAE7AF1
MAKTAKQVQTDIIALLRGSELAAEISGEVYRNGLRPRDSRLEDAVVIFTTGLPDEIETGVVTVNIYVPDIDPYENGVLVEDGERTEKLEILAQGWVDSLLGSGTNYVFELRQTIYTEAEPDIKQHFVVVKLGYRLYD